MHTSIFSLVAGSTFFINTVSSNDIVIHFLFVNIYIHWVDIRCHRCCCSNGDDDYLELMLAKQHYSKYIYVHTCLRHLHQNLMVPYKKDQHCSLTMGWKVTSLTIIQVAMYICLCMLKPENSLSFHLPNICNSSTYILIIIHHLVHHIFIVIVEDIQLTNYEGLQTLVAMLYNSLVWCSCPCELHRSGQFTVKSPT